MNALINTPNDTVNQIFIVIEDSNLAETTKVKYQRAITRAIEAGVNLLDAESLTDYARDLPRSSRGFLKAAIRMYTDKLALEAKGKATPDNALAIQATVYRIEALNEAIKVKTTKGTKAHVWLTQSEVKKLLDACNEDDPKYLRDKLVIGLLVGAGLRRNELAELDFEDILTQPVAGKFRTVINITGKGDKQRVVPINDRLASLLDKWRGLVGTGKVVRSINKAGVINGSLSSVAIFKICRRYGEDVLGKQLDPHDLRRTFAQLGYEAGISIAQISILLGHSSIATTQRYLNLAVDLEQTVSDFIPF